MLTVTDLDAGGRRLEFARGPVVFGRHRRAQVRLDATADGTSERHAEANEREGRWYLHDLGSTAGTWIGGAMVAGDVEIKSGVRVRFGLEGPTFVLEVGPRPAPRPEPLRRGTTAFLAFVDAKLRHAQRRTLVIAAVSAVVVSTLIVGMLLSRGDGADGREVAESAERAIYLLVAEAGTAPQGFCTAFAVGHDGLLATNAHCSRLVAEHVRAGARVVAKRGRARGEGARVLRWKVHPAYSGSPMSADVGLVAIEVNDGPLDVLRLADRDTLEGLAAGDAIYTVGFPGQVVNTTEPAPDFRAATIARVTTEHNGVPATPEAGRLIWHSALTSGGTSGSPILDARGRVIAINSGGATGREIKYRAADGELKTQVITEGTGLNFGVRIDLLQELLEGR